MYFLRLLFMIDIKGAKMRENLLNKKDNNTKAAEKYVGKYLLDLQNHFSLSDIQLIKILQSCLNNIKRKNKLKKWWQFF